jgi:hypothetical protein
MPIQTKGIAVRGYLRSYSDIATDRTLMVKWRGSLRKGREFFNASTCFEPLEPRMLLSGSWGTGADTPSPDKRDTHTQATVLPESAAVAFHNLTDQQSNDQNTSVVDPLAQAPSLIPSDPAASVITDQNDVAFTAESQSDINGPEKSQELIIIDGVTIIVKQISQATFCLCPIELMAKTGRSNSFVNSSFKVTIPGYQIGGVEP